MFKNITSEHLAHAYRNACMAELQALKPGNVHVFADGHGMTIDDFVKSADVSAVVIAQPHLSVGGRILYAVQATQKAVGLNTNLGLVLLCAPLIQAATFQLIDSTKTLQQHLVNVLGQLSIEDAQHAAQAIVLAKPAGLGDAAEHDVNFSPRVTLLEMMQSAQHKDRIAWQYANAFADIVDFGMARYVDAMTKWDNQAWSTTALYLGFLARQVDTHIARKYGDAVAEAVMSEAQSLEADYWVTDNLKLVQKKLLDWDASLKRRSLNPGSSADLTVATLLAVYLAELTRYS
jgi:triphosphoribosyl-dephospho-CoA synthase